MQTWINGLSERTRWGLHVAILCLPIFLSIFLAAIGHNSALPDNGFQLALLVLKEGLVWGVVFMAAFRISGITADQLRLKTSHPFRVICCGILWFLALRALLFLILGVTSQWINPRWIWESEEKLYSFSDARNVPHHPGFSFLVYGIAAVGAGLSEELWRAGMARGLEGLFPGLKGEKQGALFTIIVIAVLFGLGHLYQGRLGMAETFLLGIFLGMVLIYRNSYWEAAIAHIFFDATGFLLIFFLVMNGHLFTSSFVAAASRGDLREVEHWVNLGIDVNATADERTVRTHERTMGVTALEAAKRR
jgi:membrane protease YdiL (CAAX protease family)